MFKLIIMLDKLEISQYVLFIWINNIHDSKPTHQSVKMTFGLDHFALCINYKSIFDSKPTQI